MGAAGQPKEEQDRVSIFHPKVLALSTGTCSSVLFGYLFYRNFIRRIKTCLDITPSMLGRQIKIRGKVTRVGDGDGFRLFHTPGGVVTGWGWLRHVPTKRQDLKDETLMVRLCGIDAPERSHWGKSAQPYSEEAMEWLKSYVGGKNIKITPYLIDQYKRLIAKAQIWKWTGRKDVSAEMLKRGLALVYEGISDAEFGGNEHYYRKLEAKAKRRRKGLWGLRGNLLTPGQYKKIHYHGNN